MRHVIIGNGVAGTHAVDAIRELDPAASITTVSAESNAPYCRPMIDQLITGAKRPDALHIRPIDFYRSLGVEALLGERVVGLDLERREVETDRDRRLAFDRLLITTGADPLPLEVDGANLDNVFVLRTQKQAQAIGAAAAAANRALIIGCGPVGFKAAKALLEVGLEVTVADVADFPFSYHVDQTAGEMIEKKLASRGIEVRLGKDLVAFEGDGQVRGGRFSDGEKIPCDLAVVAVGVRPAISFLPEKRIETNLGVVVDGYLQSSVEGVFAAGDASEHFDAARRAHWVNAIWPAAANQGRIAGMNMAGRRVRYPGNLGRNTVRIFDMDVMAAGVVQPPESSEYSVEVRHEPRAERYRKLVFLEDRLVGLVLVGDSEQSGVFLSMMRQERPLAVQPHRLLNRGFNAAYVMGQLYSKP